MRLKIALLVALGVGCFAEAALAEEKAAPKARGVLELDPIKIVGRSRPILAADVARVTQRIPLATLRQPFLDRIEAAAQREPF